MFEIDHSVVFRRQDATPGSGTVVHFSSNYIVLEIYDRSSSVVLNEVFSDIQITSGRSITYDGTGVVCNVMDYSSLQIVTVFLKDSWVAFGSKDLESENRFEVERFLQLCKHEFPENIELEQKFYHFYHLLSQMIRGLQQSEQGSEQESWDKKQIALVEMADTLYDRYIEFDHVVSKGDEDTLMIVGELFKQHIYPLSEDSKIFQAFHSLERLPYMNASIQELFRMEGDFWSGKMEGVLLDVFFSKFGKLSDGNSRGIFLIDEVFEKLSFHSGDMDVLIVGTDLHPAKMINRLPTQYLSRLNIQLFSFYDEPLEDIDEKTHEIIKKKDEKVDYQSQSINFESFLSHLYQKKELGLGKFDQILITSALEPLSSKVMFYFIRLLMGCLKKDGDLCFFSKPNNQSSIRENWLLYTSNEFECHRWQTLMNRNCRCDHKNFEYGTYTRIHNEEENDLT